ncbi:MAG: MFS transporter [Azospirillum brasilense]|nr:MAG: MFS transporter [Azospirillum brasilense]
MPLPLLALAVASFGIGTTEFVIMGLLPDLALDSPLLALATGRLPRKAALIGLMLIFILGNALCALAPGYGTLMAARVVTALCHGAFFGTASVVAADLVPKHRRASAVAMVFSGLTLANVLGVPLGTAMGHALGWRSTFWAVVLIGLAAAAALALWMPTGLRGQPARLRQELRALASRQVILAMGMSCLASASLFSVFTYIAPMLQTRTGLGEHMVTLALLLFGLGLTFGNFLGGRLADWRLMPSVAGILVVLALVLAVFTATLASPVPAIATMVVWGVLVFALVSPLQMRVVDQAREAPNLASTVNQGTFNLGNAAGAWIGGQALLHGMGYGQLPWLGAGLAVLALLLALVAMRAPRQPMAMVAGE